MCCGCSTMSTSSPAVVRELPRSCSVSTSTASSSDFSTEDRRRHLRSWSWSRSAFCTPSLPALYPWSAPDAQPRCRRLGPGHPDRRGPPRRRLSLRLPALLADRDLIEEQARALSVDHALPATPDVEFLRQRPLRSWLLGLTQEQRDRLRRNR